MLHVEETHENVYRFQAYDITLQIYWSIVSHLSYTAMRKRVEQGASKGYPAIITVFPLLQGKQ